MLQRTGPLALRKLLLLRCRHLLLILGVLLLLKPGWKLLLLRRKLRRLRGRSHLTLKWWASLELLLLVRLNFLHPRQELLNLLHPNLLMRVGALRL
jgi:hypothetical protein